MTILDEMAKLILKNPNISARQIATELGYAEQKSIYYWLAKAGYRGIRDFRKAVLSKSYLPGALHPEQRRRFSGLVKDELGTGIPVFHEDSDEQHGLLWEYLGTSLSPNAFALLVKSESFEPLASPGDILVAERDAVPNTGSVCLAEAQGKVVLVRYYSTTSQGIFVSVSKPALLVQPDSVLARVAFVIRRY